MNICKEFEVENDDKTIIPAIIDSDGVIVYSTNSMASFIKVVDGQVRYDQVTYLYQKSSLTGEANYINHDSIDDVPVIEDNGNAVKVLVNGYTGWVKKDTDSKNYDVIIVPMNKAINPSYYYEKNGELYHYISKDIAKSGGYHRSIGVAPNYMKSGVKYYSYDANYFYTDINTLINDLKRNSKTSAVNYSNKYYNYYTYLPLRSKTSYTANEINSFITNNTSANSKLRGIGQSLIDAQNKYGINAILMLGISINESGWGTSSIAMNKNNLFGLNAVDSSPGASANTFTSVKHCIDKFANYWMSKGYADPEDWRFFGGFLGNKDLGINVKYVSDPFWGEKAASYAFQLDKQMSDNNINNMKDYNYYQLATYNAKTTVYTKNNKTLFSVSDYKYSADQEKVGVPVIVTNKNVKTNNGKKYTEIIPARTSQLLSSGSGGEFNGVYDWTINGYIDNSKLTMINSGKNMLENLNADIIYNSNSEGLGWQGWQCDGEVSGTEGQSRQLEAIKIQLKNYKDASIQYSVHVEDIGWQTWKSDGEVAGLENGGKRIEAVKIKSSGLPLNLQVQYRVHVQNQGWQEWTTNGQVAGIEGKALRVEAIQIRVAEKPNYVNYSAHIQNIGWQSNKRDGALSGTTGEAKRIESVKIQLVNIPNGSIEYRTHIQDIGWENEWKKDGEISGTTGESKRIEAIEIRIVKE